MRPGIPGRQHHGRRAWYRERDAARPQGRDRRASARGGDCVRLHQRVLGRRQRDQAVRDRTGRLRGVLRRAPTGSGGDAAMIRHLLAAGAILVLALGGCTKVGDTAASGGGATGGASGPHPDRLVMSTASDPRNLNPAFAIKYKLRHGIQWHDGVELTCRDLRFTWQVMMNPKNTVVTTDGWNKIHDVDCSDPYVAVVHMKQIYAPFLQQLWSLNGNGPIMPEHLLAKYNDDKGSMNTAPYNSAPVGSGPYKFVSWDRGSQVRLEAFPAYFAGKPAIREVVYKIIPDQNTLATQLLTHELDLGWNLAASSYGRLKNSPGNTVLTPVVYTFYHLDFNLKRPLFGDVRVRRALTYAIDRAGMLEKVRDGFGELSDPMLHPS